jgi:hypothetical protein
MKEQYNLVVLATSIPIVISQIQARNVILRAVSQILLPTLLLLRNVNELSGKTVVIVRGALRSWKEQ